MSIKTTAFFNHSFPIKNKFHFSHNFIDESKILVTVILIVSLNDMVTVYKLCYSQALISMTTYLNGSTCSVYTLQELISYRNSFTNYKYSWLEMNLYYFVSNAIIYIY